MSNGNPFTGRRILVTGASGYLGAAIADRLVAAQARVAGVSRTPQPARNAQIEWIAADISDRTRMDTVLRDVKPEVVFHLAGITNASRDLSRVLPSFDCNGLGTVVLLDACAKHGCERFVHCASMEEPRLGSGNVPTSPYAAGKWVGTVYARMFHSVFGLPTVVLRPFFVYGPGRQLPDKLVPHVVERYLGGEAPLLGSPDRAMDWVYIDDVVEGFLRAAWMHEAVGHDLDLGSGKLTSIRQFVEIVRNELGSGFLPTIDSRQFRQNEVSPTADVRATQSALGWVHTTPLVEGVKRTIAWYRELRP